MKPLTDEQRRLAEENHDLVYAFLQNNHLSESQYYDVVIFGYLCAVQEYCENPKLRQYSFSTVAWKKMQRELTDYYKYISRERRFVQTISLQDLLSDEDSATRYENLVGRKDKLMSQLEMDLLLHDLATKLPRRQMRIIRMKLDGAKMHEIAKAEHITFHDINRLLADSYDTVIQVCYGR